MGIRKNSKPSTRLTTPRRFTTGYKIMFYGSPFHYLFEGAPIKLDSSAKYYFADHCIYNLNKEPMEGKVLEEEKVPFVGSSGFHYIQGEHPLECINIYNKTNNRYSDAELVLFKVRGEDPVMCDQKMGCCHKHPGKHCHFAASNKLTLVKEYSREETDKMLTGALKYDEEKQYCEKGAFYRDPKIGPHRLTMKDGNVVEFNYNKNGRDERENGPHSGMIKKGSHGPVINLWFNNDCKWMKQTTDLHVGLSEPK